MPTLIMDLIDGILSEDLHLDVVARLAVGENLPTAVKRNQADILIIGRGEGVYIDMLPTEVFSWCPRAVVTVADTGKDGMVWTLRPDGTPINELSSNSLIAAARMTR